MSITSCFMFYLQLKYYKLNFCESVTYETISNFVKVKDLYCYTGFVFCGKSIEPIFEYEHTACIGLKEIAAVVGLDSQNPGVKVYTFIICDQWKQLCMPQ